MSFNFMAAVTIRSDLGTQKNKICSNIFLNKCILKGCNLTAPRQHIKKQRHYFTDKGPSSQGYGFSSHCMDVRVGL